MPCLSAMDPMAGDKRLGARRGIMIAPAPREFHLNIRTAKSGRV